MSTEEQTNTRSRAYRRNKRNTMVAHAEKLLAQLPEPITVDNLTVSEVSKLLGMSHSAMTNVIRRNYDELCADGYISGRRGQPSQLTRRAIFRIALIVRPGTSQLADQISDMVGARPRNEKEDFNSLSHAHVMQAVAHLEKAAELAVSIRDEDPQELWLTLSRMDRYRLQAVTMALASMVPDDKSYNELTRWLRGLSGKNDGTAGAGLGMLLPSKHKAKELDRIRAAHATRSPGYGDREVGIA